jgi:hypothetical protein
VIKKFLVLALLIAGFLLVGNAYAEDEVYYCGAKESTGFYFNDKSKEYTRSKFEEHKFKIKLNRDVNYVEMAHDIDTYSGKYTCQAPYSSIDEPELLSCSSRMFHFNFNSTNGRFVFMTGGGYVGGDGDSINISHGKCDKF